MTARVFPLAPTSGTRLRTGVVNRPDYSKIGLRAPSETAYYPGLDMVYRRDGTSLKFVTRDGHELDSGDEVARVSGDPDDLKPPSDLDID